MEQWEKTVVELEAAINNRNLWRDSQAECRISCSYVPEEKHQPDFGIGYSQYSVLRGSCIARCLKKHLGEKYAADQRFSTVIEDEFAERKPFQYLNVAYYNVGRLADAVAAAYTFFQGGVGDDPTGEEALATLDFYDHVDGVNKDWYVDLLVRPHLKSFEEAAHAYKIENYADSVVLFQNALLDYFEEIKDCRALCELPVDLGDKYSDTLPFYHKFQVRLTNLLAQTFYTKN